MLVIRCAISYEENGNKTMYFSAYISLIHASEWNAEKVGMRVFFKLKSLPFLSGIMFDMNVSRVFVLVC